MIEKVIAAFSLYDIYSASVKVFGSEIQMSVRVAEVSVEGKCNKTKTNNFEYVRLHVVYLICFNSQKWIKKNFNSTNELKMS